MCTSAVNQIRYNTSYGRIKYVNLKIFMQTGKSKFPLLSTLNIQIKSYNYPVLESYQAFIHKLANIIQIDIDDW